MKKNNILFLFITICIINIAHCIINIDDLPEHLKDPAYSYFFTEYYKILPSNTTRDYMSQFLPAKFVTADGMEVRSCSVIDFDGPCTKDQYCGFQVGIEKRRLSWCYNFPTFIDKNEGPKIIAKFYNHPRKGGFSLCNDDSACKCPRDFRWCDVDELLRCDMSFGFKFPFDYNFDTYLYNGICVKSRLVAFIHSKTYLNLGSDVLFEERRKKYYPVGNQYGDTVMSQNAKKCTTNQDCGGGQFCGPVLDFSTNTPHTGPNYCFPAPTFLDSNNNPIVFYTGGPFELLQCDSNTRCPLGESLRCYHVTQQEFVPQNNNWKNSFCIKEHPVAYIFSETFFNFSSDIPFEKKKKYFPIDYVDLHQSSALKKCSINKDCSEKEFCASMFDYTTNTSSTARHCYKVPKLPYTSRMPRIIPIFPDSNELFVCNSDSDCVSDDIWQCESETGQKFMTEKFGEKGELKNGLCILAPPVAFTFSQTFLDLSSEIPYDYKRRYFPVDYLEPEEENTLASCSLNRDCQQGQFCDRILDFVNKKTKGSRTHCFAIPRIDPAENTQIIIESNEFGLMLCNSTDDCFVDLFCNTGTGQKYLKWNDDNAKGGVIFDGVCMKDLNPKPLPPDSTWLIILTVCVFIGVVIAGGAAATVFSLKKKKIKLESKGSAENVQSPVNQLESKASIDNVALKPVPSRTASLDNVVVQKQ